MIKKNILVFLISFLFLLPNFSDSIRISQIDSSSLLLDQKIRLYLSVTDAMGEPLKNLTKDNFTVYESINERDYKKIDHIVDFRNRGNDSSGINFLLLVDNSGSMYFDMNGREIKETDKMRITYAKNAIRTFLNSITKPADKVGLASYNSYYTFYTPPITDRERINAYLDDIRQGKGDENWTEIYSSLTLAIEDFNTIKGRKVIIILSDGENMPYYTNTKKEHKLFGKKIFTYTEPIDTALKEGVSIYVINYGSPLERKDQNLKTIAYQTGGTVFDAYHPEELNNIYQKIVNQIINEYLITYKATMDPAEKKYVKVDLNHNGEKNEVKSYYFSSFIFGTPAKDFNPLFLLIFLLAIVLLILLSFLNFKREKAPPSLEVISTQVGKTIQKTLVLNKGQTIIGGSTKADMTIVGVPKMKENHATIQFDDNKQIYTLVAGGDLTVNNKRVKTKVLESGDVINVEGTTIVFDEGLMDKTQKKKKKKK